MADEASKLTLADWRRSVAELYAAARRAGEFDQDAAARGFRAARDELFKRHPQTPLDAAQRISFTDLDYFPYDPAWRVLSIVEQSVERESWKTDLPEGLLRYTRDSVARFVCPEGEGQLSLFWIEGYGGGLFLPFRDGTNNRTSYGGGRYLYDTIKGADLGVGADEIVLDFNYAYNPSCAYAPKWVCPLAPRENTLAFEVVAGEKSFPRRG